MHSSKKQRSIYIYDNLAIMMNPKTLVFSDSSYEKDYELDANRDNVLLTRFAVILTALLFAIYATLDPYTYPSYYYYLWLIRFFVVMFLLLLFIYSFNENYIKNMQTTAFMQIFVVGGGLLSLFLFPTENSFKYVFTANYVLIPVGMFVMTGLRFKNVLLTSAILTITIYIIIFTQFNILSMTYYIFLFTSVTVISIVGAYFTELYRRKLFLKNRYTDRILGELSLANKKLENLSITDELTKVRNRRSFNETIKREINRARRDEKQIAFMMIDIDFFKLYNDTYGHLEGDKALKKVAKALEDTFQRSSDFVFRLGGEEFGVLLCDTKKDDAQTLACRVCTTVEELKIEHKASIVNESVTISVGMSYRKVENEIDENFFMKSADDALYEAKETGKNRCVFA